MRRAGRRHNSFQAMYEVDAHDRRTTTAGTDDYVALDDEPTPGDAATRRPHRRWATTRCSDDQSSRRRRRRRRAAAAAADERSLRAAAAALQVAARAGAGHAFRARRAQIPTGRRRRARRGDGRRRRAVDHGETKAHDVHRPALHGVAHVELSRALGELDLVAGVSTYGDDAALACRGGRACKHRRARTVRPRRPTSQLGRRDGGGVASSGGFVASAR